MGAGVVVVVAAAVQVVLVVAAVVLLRVTQVLVGLVQAASLLPVRACVTFSSEWCW